MPPVVHDKHISLVHSSFSPFFVPALHVSGVNLPITDSIKAICDPVVLLYTSNTATGYSQMVVTEVIEETQPAVFLNIKHKESGANVTRWVIL